MPYLSLEKKYRKMVDLSNEKTLQDHLQMDCRGLGHPSAQRSTESEVPVSVLEKQC